MATIDRGQMKLERKEDRDERLEIYRDKLASVGRTRMKLPYRKSIMAVHVMKPYAATAWAKIERKVDPPWKGWEGWLGHVRVEDCQRCIMRPAVGKVGSVTGVGVTKTFERRIEDHLFHNKVDYLIWCGDEDLLETIKESPYWTREHAQRRVVRVVDDMPLSSVVAEVRMAKFRCETALSALLDVMRADSWLDIDISFGRGLHDD